jgi:hypothetical protein
MSSKLYVKDAETLNIHLMLVRQNGVSSGLNGISGSNKVSNEYISQADKGRFSAWLKKTFAANFFCVSFNFEKETLPPVRGLPW